MVCRPASESARLPGTDGRKMSKSYGNVVNLGDEPEERRRRIAEFLTDPARKRRKDAGNPFICPVYHNHRIFSPEDGRRLGLDGMIRATIEMADYSSVEVERIAATGEGYRWGEVAEAISRAEHGQDVAIAPRAAAAPVLGVTGTGGSGKSSLVDELVLRFLADSPNVRRTNLRCECPIACRTPNSLLR